MKLKVLTVATHPDNGLEQLERSLKAYKYDYEVLGMGKEWKGFGTKLKEVHEWCKKTDYTHILFLDAYDTFAIGQLDMLEMRGLYFNAEKKCWPDVSKKDMYPCRDMPYPYLNSGMYLANVKTLLQIFEENPYEYKTDDQRYFTDIFLSERYDVSLDYDTEYLMTIAFSQEGKDYKITDKVTNLYSGNTPCFIHGNGKTDMTKIYDIYTMEMLMAEWQDNRTTHKAIHDKLCHKLQEQPDLWALREYVEKNSFGFGERSFYPMWQMIVSKMQDGFSMLEVGVFRGQTLALVRMLANKDNKSAQIFGVTPLDTTDGHWESDYAKDIALLHDTFKLEHPNIIKGLSTDSEVIAKCGMYDALFIDGGHSYEVVKSDLANYCPKVKKGGYLVIDDSCNNIDIPNGMFGGIASVTKAVEEYFPNNEFEFLFNVVHNRVYRKL